MQKGLYLEKISKIYQDDNGETIAIKDFSFNFEKGKFYSIVGPSGCGKSTLLSIIAGLENASSGRIFVDDVLKENVSNDIRLYVTKRLFIRMAKHI